MVLGLLSAVAACPAIVGVNEAVQSSQRSNAKQKHRGRKVNLVVSCADPSSKLSKEVNGCYIVLRDRKLYVSTIPEPDSDDEDEEQEEVGPPGHPFAGYFFQHPDYKWGKKGEGLVSTIYDDPPMLNWIYIDKDTYEVKYGTRKESEGHYLGPWNCTPVDKRVTFDGWEGFAVAEEKVMVEENSNGEKRERRRKGKEKGLWGLYFDMDDNGLGEKVPMDRRVLEVELVRKEMRLPPVEDEDQEPK